MKAILKPRMTSDEMTEVFIKHNPALVPNFNNVGRFAKRIGYKRAKQQLNGVLEYFYMQVNPDQL